MLPPSFSPLLKQLKPSKLNERSKQKERKKCSIQTNEEYTSQSWPSINIVARVIVVVGVVWFGDRKKHAFGANSKLIKMDLFDIFWYFCRCLRVRFISNDSFEFDFSISFPLSLSLPFSSYFHLFSFNQLIKLLVITRLKTHTRHGQPISKFKTKQKKTFHPPYSLVYVYHDDDNYFELVGNIWTRSTVSVAVWNSQMPEEIASVFIFCIHLFVSLSLSLKLETLIGKLVK